MQVSELLKAHKYPAWIASHEIFKSVKSIKKIFPGIGLADCEEEVVIDNSIKALAYAKYLLPVVAAHLDRRIQRVTDFEKKGAKIGKARRLRLTDLISFMTVISNGIKKNPDSFLTVNNGRVTFNLAENVLSSEKKVVFKKGEGLLRVYNKLNELLKENKFASLRSLEKTQQFMDFSSANIPSDKFKIKFASENADGVWDIATMSMRGIQSCQSWAGGGGNARCVIGSMVDPFTAIIYLTSGAKYNEYGTKMIRRCIVRFVVDSIKKSPYIMLERMYPALDEPTLDTFKKFIEKKVGNIPVRYAPSTDHYLVGRSYIPFSNDIKSLPPAELPYRDCHIPFKEDTTYCVKDLHELLKEKKDALALKIGVILKSAIKSEVKISELKDFTEAAKDIIRHLKGGKKRLNKVGFYEYYDDHSTRLDQSGNRFVEFIDTMVMEPDRKDAVSYTKKLYSSILEQKAKNVEFMIADFVKHLRINENLAKFIVTKMFPKIDVSISTELKKLIK